MRTDSKDHPLARLQAKIRLFQKNILFATKGIRYWATKDPIDKKSPQAAHRGFFLIWFEQ
jgi:hypothetical protein